MDWVRIRLTVLRSNPLTKVVTVLVLALLAVLFGTLQSGLVESSWAMHSVRVQVTAGRFDALVSKAGADARAYLLTGDPEYRRAYESRKEEAVVLWGDLRGLTADNPSQQTQANAVRVELALKFRELDELVTLGSDPATHPAAVARFRTGTSARIHARLEETVANFFQEEERLAAARRWQSVVWFGASVLLAVLLAGFLAWAAVRWAEEYRRQFVDPRVVLPDPPTPPAPVPYSPGGMTGRYHRRHDDPPFNPDTP